MNTRSSGFRPPLGRLRGDSGMVTAEIAVAVPTLVVLLSFALAAVAVVGAQLRCVDAAREGARTAARGGAGAAAIAAAVAPPHAHVTIGRTAGRVRAQVAATVRPVGGILPGFAVSADAVALPEPGEP